MPDPTQIPIRATTQEHLDIEDVQDDLVILKDGSVCLLLQVSAVNFGLLSEQEQDATIFAYAGLLNSLTFPVQIVIKSQRKDVSQYLKLLKNEEEKQKNPVLKDRIQKYRIFVESTVRENNVLDKKFYVVIPFSCLELGVKGAGSGVFKKGLPYPKNYILERAKTALFPKRDHLIRQFNRLGLKTMQLNTKELIELFFKTYNPESIGAQQITETQEYTKPVVEAAVETPTILPVFPKKETPVNLTPPQNTPPPPFSSSPPAPSFPPSPSSPSNPSMQIPTKEETPTTQPKKPEEKPTKTLWQVEEITNKNNDKTNL